MTASAMVRSVRGCTAVLAWLMFPGPAFAQEPVSFSKGFADTVTKDIFDCNGSSSRNSGIGTIRSDDGKQWTVPADTNFVKAPKAPDLYNQCTGVTPRGTSDVDLSVVPVIDAGGAEPFTIYIFADNYFELYINGQLLAVDAVPFTPFNSSVVRFKSNRPFVVAIMGVDWEENLGLGSEWNRGVPFHPGDAGFVAVIKDKDGRIVEITDGSWRAQTYYTAPLHDRNCMKQVGPVRDSRACSTDSVRNGQSFSAAFWPVPPDWFSVSFDDSLWPQATVFSNETVGVRNKPAFMNFRDLFDDPKRDAQFIWSSNLVLDNLVLMRKVVR